MGRTLPTFRMALEQEILSWKKGYYKALRNDDKIIFDMLLNLSRLHSDAGSMSGKSIVFEVMIINILIEIQKQILLLNSKIQELLDNIRSKYK
ncbi:MAG: hypothetical protein ACTSRP_25745 [Candidatus Helarchaeota archaeon]